jgi:flavin reductase (DIM6/NTAB) family NADH-FMN oxidoreductase RutF
MSAEDIERARADLVWPDEPGDDRVGEPAAQLPETPSPQLLRAAFGRYATGVTLVTCGDAAGQRTGLTVNSFSSLSLEPPLVLWSLRLRSTNLDAFTAARCFVVNVLKQEHAALSRWFATAAAAQRFDQGLWRAGLGGAPVLQDASASFECELRGWHDEGDHRLFIGRVWRVSQSEGEPLIYLQGGYRSIGAAG